MKKNEKSINIIPNEHEKLFENILSSYFTKRFKNRERRTGFHCSSADSCARQIGYDVAQETPTNLPNLQQEMRWLVGHYVEKILDEAFEKSKILYSTNEKFKAKVKYGKNSETLTGELDQIIHITPESLKENEIDIESLSPELKKLVLSGNAKYIVDIKTCGMTSWNFIPKDGNIFQIQLYMKYMKIDNAFLLYINPDTGKYRIFYFKFDQKIINGIAKKYKYILKHLCEKTEIEREYDNPHKFPCSWDSRNSTGSCQYFNKCWGDGIKTLGDEQQAKKEKK